MASIPNFNKLREKPLVLLAPLDWGLGHTTRCIPIVRELMRLNCDVLIACNSSQKAVLAAEFPEIGYRIITGYNLKYGKSRWLTLARIISQIPKILISIKRENRWLQALLKQQQVDAVISDNRFGLFSNQIPCIFITHQLAIKTGLGRWADAMVSSFNYRAINRFTACWVPDYKGSAALAGELSNPTILPTIPVQYLGALSRFTACNHPVITSHLLIILSGPEPQRTLFENKLMKQLSNYKGQVTLVRGCPDNKLPSTTNELLTIHQHVDARTLNALACSADIIVSRSGYTTVMDIIKMKKKSILVPTPGQAEQEYLAGYLYCKHWGYAVNQDAFDLMKALDALAQVAIEHPSFDMEQYKIIIEQFVASLRS